MTTIHRFPLQVSCALNILIFDEAKHHWINRTLLGSNLLLSSGHLIMSILSVRAGNILKHKDHAIKCFLYSIEGAGTIRTVAFIQEIVAPYVPHVFTGLGKCQSLYSGEANKCIVMYLIRLIFIRVLTDVYICIYITIEKKSNHVKVLITEYLNYVFCHICFCMLHCIVSFI